MFFSRPLNQDRTSLLRSHQPSNTSTVSSCASSRTYTTRTTPKSFTCVPNRTSTRSSRTSSHSVVSTSCWTSRTFAARLTRRRSASAPFGSAGEKWAFLNLDSSRGTYAGKQSRAFKSCRSLSSPLTGRLKRCTEPCRKNVCSCYLINPAHASHTHTHSLLYYPSCPLLPAPSDQQSPLSGGGCPYLLTKRSLEFEPKPRDRTNVQCLCKRMQAFCP